MVPWNIPNKIAIESAAKDKEEVEDVKRVIFCEVHHADSDVPVTGVDVSQVVHRAAPDDNDAQLNYKEEHYMDNLSGSHAHFVFKQFFNEGRAHLKFGTSSLFAFQSSDENCVDEVGFD